LRRLKGPAETGEEVREPLLEILVGDVGGMNDKVELEVKGVVSQKVVVNARSVAARLQLFGKKDEHGASLVEDELHDKLGVTANDSKAKDNFLRGKHPVCFDHVPAGLLVDEGGQGFEALKKIGLSEFPPKLGGGFGPAALVEEVEFGKHGANPKEISIGHMHGMSIPSGFL
jgi:hypothetical protein